jgi:hypothetical protein
VRGETGNEEAGEEGGKKEGEAWQGMAGAHGQGMEGVNCCCCCQHEYKGCASHSIDSVIVVIIAVARSVDGEWLTLPLLFFLSLLCLSLHPRLTIGQCEHALTL